VDGFTNVYSKYLAPNGELNGLGIAIGSRLIPQSQFTGEDNQKALLNALTNMTDLASFPYRSIDPRLLTYGAPLQILMTAPTNYPVSADNDTSAVTPAWREAVWHVLSGNTFSNTASVSDIQAAFRSANSAADVLRKLLPDNGADQNEADVLEPDPASTFWGQKNYDRLMSIKKEIDPDNILTCWNCIGWDSKDEKYSCYPSIE